MALRDILLWPDPRLSQPCAPVGSDEDLSALIADMFDTMYNAPGRGLAAPQVGVMQRVFVMDTGWKEGARAPKALINPQILTHSDMVAVHAEGCLSIPGLQVDVIRPAEVTLAYTDATGALCEDTFTGFAAACAQHELDHLDGRVTFDRLLPEARAEAEADYARVRA